MASEKGQTEQKADANQAAPFRDRTRNLVTVAVVGGLMLLEGVGLVVAVKMTGAQPAEIKAENALGGAMVDEEGNMLPEQSEVHVSDVVAVNDSDGRIYVYQIQVYAVVDTKIKTKVQEFFENHRNTIDDRLGRAVRAADHKYFDEPDLQTLRRQFKVQLDQLLQDEAVIKEILFPQFNKSRAD